MCVEEVKSLYTCMKPVVKHFQQRSKSKERLDSAMAMLHLMSWCATCMAHFIEACVLMDDILIPLYNTTYSGNIRNEDGDKLFSAENIYIVKLLHDLRDRSVKDYLRKVHKTDQLVSEVYKTDQDTLV